MTDNKLRIISIISYSLIVLAGQMIGLPFILWLIFISFSFGHHDQIFAICGILGLFMNFIKFTKSRKRKILSFILMISPIAKRLTETPIEKFNYLAFQIPFFVFLITYLIFILIPSDDKKTACNGMCNEKP
ncbi:hypothetical protein GZ212_10475 [Mangrovimonas sp. CR14]|uniref:hypothetical protein n=1 Tax=Mangrovimonas sp. CR14 TaxID=2706120 RepID=UPI00141F2DE3|nr:hypothetical protein [Mangrovimonas sp. CR14]NIK92574.1 hypothetical protein [Mangrovimonas sp. CR14]